MDMEQLSDRINARIDELRDRSAELVRADGESVFREFSALRSDLGETESRLSERIDERADGLGERLSAVLTAKKRTTWPRRAWWLGVGLAIGAGVAYLLDPDRGRHRRDQLTDQLGAKAREARSTVEGEAQRRAGEAKGAAIESVKDALPEDVPDDPKVLEQRVRSHALGGRDDVHAVVVRVDGPGRVALKGTVADATVERDVVAAVSDVEGVTDVISELELER